MVHNFPFVIIKSRLGLNVTGVGREGLQRRRKDVDEDEEEDETDMLLETMRGVGGG